MDLIDLITDIAIAELQWQGSFTESNSEFNISLRIDVASILTTVFRDLFLKYVSSLSKKESIFQVIQLGEYFAM
jgi:hypothetical protein